jgi:hypothetical protein
MIAALGVGSRPSISRTLGCKVSWMRSQAPSFLHRPRSYWGIPRCAPRWQVVGYHAPGAATAQHLQSLPRACRRDSPYQQHWGMLPDAPGEEWCENGHQVGKLNGTRLHRGKLVISRGWVGHQLTLLVGFRQMDKIELISAKTKAFHDTAWYTGDGLLGIMRHTRATALACSQHPVCHDTPKQNRG